LNGSVTIASGGQWSGGLGTFTPNANTLNATYTPAAAELILGTITLTLTSTGNGNCVPVSSTMTINYTPAPLVNAGPNQNACANNSTVTLAGTVSGATGGQWSGGTGTFVPNNLNLNAQYTPSAAEITAGTVTLTLTSVGNGNCIPVTSTITITIPPAPTANAGPNQTLCANNALATLNGSVTNANGGIWTGGAGTFNPSATALSATYTPTAGELSAGSVSLTLTTTGIGNCIAVSDVMNITYTLAPTANAGVDLFACENNSTVTLNGSVTIASGGTWTGGLGTFSPNNNTLNATYTPTLGEIAGGSVTLTLTTTGNGNCVSANDVMTINYTPAPSVSAGANQTVCSNNALVTLSGTVVGATGGIWSGGAGSFFPNAINLNPSYTPTPAEIAAGTLTLTLTSAGNGTCNPVSATTTITFSPSPVVNAGANQNICSNNTLITLSGSVTVATGGIWTGGSGTFSPNNTTLGATYQPTAAEVIAGTLTLTLTSTGNGNCNAVSNTVSFTFTPSPTANAGANQTLCSNNPSATLNGSVTVATGGTWSGGAGGFSPGSNNLNAVYTPSPGEITAGSVTLTLTTTGNGNCLPATSTTTLFFTPSPTANAGANQSICANNATAVLNGSVTIATGGTWSGGAGTFAPNANTLNAVYTPTAGEITAGTVTLTLTTTGNGNCNPVSATTIITITPAPTVNAGVNQTVCANNANITLNGQVTVATGGIWSGGAGSFVPNNTTLNAQYIPTAGELASGTISLTLTTTGNGNCLSVNDVMVITITPSPTANAGANQTLCSNNASISLNGSVTIATGGTWSGGSGTFVPNANTLNAVYNPSAGEIASGSLTLTLSTTGNGGCLPASDEITINFTPSPTANAGANQSVCANNAAATLNGSVTIATGGTWSGGAGTFAPNANTLNTVYTPTAGEITAGTVTLTLTTTGNGTCNPVSATTTITITPAPIVNAGANQTLCANNAVANLNGAILIATGAVWTGGAGLFSPANTALNAAYTPTLAEIASGSVTLTLTSTGNGNCLPVSDTMTILFTPDPTANAGPDQALCANNPVIVLAGSVTVASGGAWSGGLGTFSPNASTLTPTYTPTQTEINAGSVTLTLTTTGNGNCIPASDLVTINFGTAPTANAGIDQTVCANNVAVTLSGIVTVATGGTWTGGNGTFAPNANTLNAVYTPSAAEITAGTVSLTLTTTGNGNCIAVSDIMAITITPAPTANAGANQLVCANSALVQLNGAISIATGGIWSGGNGTFNPGNTSLSATYTPSAGELAAGTVTLTLTTTGNGLCNPVTSAMTITINPAPVVNAGPDQVLCSNNATAQLAASITNATGGVWTGGSGSFSPSSSALNAQYTPSIPELLAGTVTLTLTSTGNGNCQPESDVITLSYTPSPTANAGANQTLCSNNAQIQLNGAVTIAVGGIWSGGTGTFSPNNFTLNATYNPTPAEIAAGSLSLTLTTVGNGNCNPVTSITTITFTPSPIANAGPNLVSCENNPTVTLLGSVSNAGGGIWSGGNGTFNPNNTTIGATYTPSAAEVLSGVVTLTLTTTNVGNCLPVSDQMNITFTPAPIVNAGGDQNICTNNPLITLSGSVVGATGGLWSGGLGTFSPSTSALNATYNPAPFEIAAGNVLLTLTSTGNGSCSPVFDVVAIVFTASPTVNAGGNQTVCSNNAATQLNGSVTIAAGGIWTGGNGSFAPNANTLNAIYTPTAGEIASGQMTLTLTTTGNGNCLPVSTTMNISFSPSPVVNPGSNITVCSNNATANLNGSITIATGGIWSGGGGSFVPNNTSLTASYTATAGEITNGFVTLTLTSTGNGSCNPVSNTVTIFFSPSPTANAGADQVKCSNNASTQLGGAVTIATGGSWSGGNGSFAPNANTLTAVYNPSQNEITAGFVTLTLTTTGNQGCLPVTDTMTITFTPAPTANAGSNISVCSNNSAVTLSGAVTIANGGIWSGGAGTFNPSATSLNATYQPTAAEIAGGSMNLTLTTTGNGDCNAVTDDVLITFTPSPTANAGSNLVACENNPTVNLNGSVTVATGGTWTGGAGTFAPNANALNAVYTATAGEVLSGSVTLTLTTTGNGSCNAVNDLMVITFSPSPTANAGAPQTICSNNPSFVLNGSVTIASGGAWSGGLGTFTPNANALNAQYTPTQTEINAGSITLTLTTTGNGNCLPATSQVTITFSPSPTANAGNNQSKCENNPLVTLNGSVTVATGGVWSGGAGLFDPSANVLNATYLPTAGEIALGSLTLTLTTTGNGNCNAVSDDMTITFTPAPIVDAGPNKTACANNAQISVSASVIGATGVVWSGGNGVYDPNNTSVNIIYFPSASEIASGSITLTATTSGNGNCNPVSDEMVITITPPVVANAGNDQVLCANNAVIPLNGSVVIATGGVWSGGLGSFSPNSATLNANYTPTAGEIAAGTLTLTLTTTGNGQCVSASDVVTFTFTPAPTVDAGPNATVCGNNAAVALSGSFTISSGVIWSGGAGTFAPNNTNINAVYTPSAAEIAAGTATLTLTTTGNGTCVAVSDVMTITITPAPTANAGANQTLCANNVTAQLNGSVTVATGGQWSGGNGIFSPNNNTLNAQYTPSATEIAAGTVTLTLTTTGNGLCNQVTSTMTINITPQPVVNAGVDQTLCANNAAVSLNGSVSIATGGTWSGGAGTFSPNPNALNATYNPSAGEIAQGFVTLTLASTGNGNCVSVSDNLTISFTPAPTANAGVDVIVCANNVNVNLNGNVTVATGGIWSGGAGTFTPNATTLNAVYTPSAAEITAGTVSLTLTTTGNGLCLSVTDVVAITITPAPTVNAGNNQTRCANNVVTQLNGSVTVATGGIWSGGNGLFEPNNTALNAQYTPSAAEIAAGSVTLTLTTTGNGLCNPEIDTMVITITPEPTANAGANQVLCSNNASVLLNGSVTVATGGTWSGGSGTFAPSASTLNATYIPSAGEIAAGSLTLTLTTTGNGNCISVTDEVLITFTPSPTANANADQVVCANNANVSLNGSVTVATGGIWSGGAGTFAPNATTLNAVYTPTAAEITSGTVSLTLTTTGNGNCLAVTDVMVITITPAPTANAGTDKISCANNPAVTMTGSVTIASGGTWSGGAGTFSPDANTINAVYTPSAGEIAAGTVTLTLTTTGNGNCLPVTDTMVITINASPIVNAGTDQTLCANNNIALLNGSVANATGGQWSGGLGTFAPNATTLNASYTPTQTELNAGFVNLTLTSTGNGTCASESDVVTINYSPAPTASAGANQTVCANNVQIQLNGVITVASGAIWSGGAGTFSPNATTLNAIYTPSATEITAGTVTLTLTTTGNGNCIAVSSTVTITITPAPIVNAGTDKFSCANSPTVTITGTVTGSTGGTWTGGTGTFDPNANSLSISYTPSASEIAAGSVTLTLTSTGNGLCNPVSDIMVINIAPLPIVNAGIDQSVCANSPVLTLAGSVINAGGGTWSGGAGTFAPNTNTLNATYTPTAAEIAQGFVNLTLTSTGNGTCLPEFDVVNMIITPAPVVDAGPNVTVCADLADVQLNGSITVATGGIWSGGTGTFNPNNTTLNAIYTPSFAEISTGSVNLTLTSTGNGNCLQVTDVIAITIQPVPFVNAGPDINVCANNAQTQLGGIFFNATGALWTGGLGTFIPNNADINAIYIPTNAEILSGGLTLTLTTFGTGVCAPRSDQVAIIISPAPLVNAGLDIVRCENNPNAQLNGSISFAGGGIWSGGAGTFLPNVTTLTANYVPTPAEIALGSVTLTLTSTGNGNCAAVFDLVIITFSPEPIVNAGGSYATCVNNPNVQLNGTVSVATGGVWSGGLGIFIPGNNVLNAVYVPTAGEIANGGLTLTLTSTGNGDCLAVTDVLDIDITPNPFVDAGNNIVTCVTDLQVQLNGIVSGPTSSGIWTTSGTGFFTPSNTALNAVYNISSADSALSTITLTLTSTNNGNCIAVTDQITVTVLPPGIATAGPDVTVCGNNSAIFLNGTISGLATSAVWTTSGDGIFIPNATTLNATYLPGPGDIANGGTILTITANSCDQASDNMLVTITPAPIVNAGANVTVCVTSMNVALNGQVSGANTTGIWTTSGTGTFVPNNTTLNATYMPSAGDSLATTVTLTLTATNIGNCNPVSDQLVVTIFPQGFVNAGPNTQVCSNVPEVTLNGTISGGASQVLWTTTGTGTFANANALNTVYTPSATDIANGLVNLVLTATNSCNFASDFMTVSIVPGPEANAGPDQAVCEAIFNFPMNGSVQVATGGVWSTNGTGTFGNPTALNTTYFATQEDLNNGLVTIYLTTTGNGNCIADVDSLTIIITTGIVALAGADQQVCESAAETQLQGVVSNGSVTGIWTTSGTGAFVPNNTTLNAAYVFSPQDFINGSVTVTLTSTNNGVCNSAVDEMTITFGPSPYVDAGADQEICADNLLINVEGFVTGGATTGVWSSSGTGVFTTPNNLQSAYIPSAADAAAGSVIITLTSTNNGNCQPGLDTFTLTILPIPVVNAGADIVVCNPSVPTPLSGSIQFAGGGTWTTSGTGVFLPDNNALNAFYLASTADSLAGSVTMTLTSTNNGLCNEVSDTVVLQIGNELTADAGADQTICTDDLQVILSGAVGGNTTTGIWSTSGNGTFVPDNTTLNAVYIPGTQDVFLGTVVLTLTTTNNSGCPAVSDALVVTIQQLAVIDAGSNVDVCAAIEPIVLNATTSNTTAIIWSTSGDGTFTPDAFTVGATYNPTQADSLTGSVTLTLTSNNGGVCPDVSDVITIIFHPLLTANAGVDFVICDSDLTIALDGLVTGTTGGVWTSSGTGTFTPSADVLNASYIASTLDSIIGSVTLTLTTAPGTVCPSASDAVIVTFERTPGANAGSDIVSCTSTTAVQIAGTVTNATGGIWSSSGTGAFVPNNTSLNATYLLSEADIASGTVTLTLTSTGNVVCDAATDELMIILSNPLIAGFDVQACAGQTAQFFDQTIVLSGVIATWNWDLGNGETSTLQNPTTLYPLPGNYTVTLTVTNSDGCVDEVTTIITVGEIPTADFSVIEDVDGDGTYAFIDESEGATSWFWDFGDGVGTADVQNPSYLYAESGLYTVVQIVTNEFGCSDSTLIVLNYESLQVLPPKLPNAFSPNGDGMNDVYYVLGGPFESFDFRVYNNWGELIFTSNAQENGWDGTHRGRPVEVGVYVYVVKATTILGEAHEKTGQITVLR
jgi:gliding motility-associated-like protein